MLGMKKLVSLLVCLCLASFCTDILAASENCSAAPELGRFSPAADLLIANFDNKPDTDDLLAAAGLGTMLRDERFACVHYIAVTGAYARNLERVTDKAADWRFIEADTLFDIAFPGNWVDAHKDRQAAVELLADRALDTLREGGDIWITEGGHSDLTAAVAQRLMELESSIDLESRVHLLQHSSINEMLTTPAALDYVRSQLNYIKIADGNEEGNGTPGFKTENGKAWPELLTDPESGAIWTEARRLALAHNGKTGHENEAIAAGGLDFSDLAAATYVFGFEDLADVDAFVTEFVQQ